MNAIDTVHYSDYSSLRPLTMALDSLGDDFLSKAERDVETLSYWTFQSDRKDPKAYYELGVTYAFCCEKPFTTTSYTYTHTLTHSHTHTHTTGRIYQLGLHGVRRDMSAAADHYERATASAHPGALGESFLLLCAACDSLQPVGSRT